MNLKFGATAIWLLAAVGTVAFAADPVPASDPQPPLKASRDTPRTRDGRPDLQGVVWTSGFFAMLETSPMTPAQLVLSEAEAKAAFDRLVSDLMGNPAIKTFIDADPLGGQPLVAALRSETHSCYAGERSTGHPWGFGCGVCDACRLRAAGWAKFTGDGQPARG